MAKEEVRRKPIEGPFAPGADPCSSFKICWGLGSTRPYCADVTAHDAITGKGSPEAKLLLKVEDQLKNMETCLHSMVILLSELSGKENP